MRGNLWELNKHKGHGDEVSGKHIHKSAFTQSYRCLSKVISLLLGLVF